MGEEIYVRIPGLEIRSFAHFAQIKWATLSDSLRSLKTNEQLWANRSIRSKEMSNREQIAQVAQDKWATVSDSLRSLRGNEYMSDSLKNFGYKKSKILFFSMFYIQIFEQRWVKLTDVLDSADSSSEMFWKAPNQAQRCSEQRWVKLRDVLDSAESS